MGKDGFALALGNIYSSVSYSSGIRQECTDVLVDGMAGGPPTLNGNAGVGVFLPVDVTIKLAASPSMRRKRAVLLTSLEAAEF